MSERIEITEPKFCDFCEKAGKKVKANYDARTVFGSWANMCARCWREFGIGKLGTGYGQRLVLRRQ